jgi:hypothetical protein
MRIFILFYWQRHGRKLCCPAPPCVLQAQGLIFLPLPRRGRQIKAANKAAGAGLKTSTLKTLIKTKIYILSSIRRVIVLLIIKKRG